MFSAQQRNATPPAHAPKSARRLLTAKWLLAAMLLAALALVSPVAAEEWILFSSDRKGSFDIWKIHPDGSGLELVAESPTEGLFYPKVSPDGKQLSYAVVGAQRLIRVQDLRTGATRDYPVFNANRHDWSADMTQIWSTGFTRTSCRSDLDVLDLATGQVTGVVVQNRRQAFMGVDWTTGEVYWAGDPCWSPANVLYATNPATGTTRVVKGNDNRSGENAGDIRPDGQEVVYVKSLVGFTDPQRIFVLPSSGQGQEVQISTNTGIGDADPDYSPDGSQVVFYRKVSSTNHELWIVGRDGTSEALLHSDGYRNITPEWATADVDEPPVALCQDLVLSADATCSANASVDAGSFDPDGDLITLTQNPAGPYGLGTTAVELEAEANGAISACSATVSVVDDTAPVLACNAPATISLNEAPISFRASATDNCAAPIVQVDGFACFKFTKKYKRIDKSESCVVETNGDSISILDAGGVGTTIEWDVVATDTGGNETQVTCSVDIVNPAHG